MKMAILSLAVLSVMLVPSFSYAQTPSSEEIRDQYQAALVQLIGLLQQQLAVLVAQLDAQSADVAEIKKTVKATTSNTGGSTDTTVTAPNFTINSSVEIREDGTPVITLDKDVQGAHIMLTNDKGYSQGLGYASVSHRKLEIHATIPAGTVNYVVTAYNKENEEAKDSGSFVVE